MRQFADVEDLSELVHDAVGTRARVTAVDRLRGGTKKGVYRAFLDGSGPPSVIVYSWADGENFWPESDEHHPVDLFTHAGGLPDFQTVQQHLTHLGVRVPRLLLADDSHRRYPADVAVVEDVAGGTLEELFNTDPSRGPAALVELADQLALMHGHRRQHFGRLADPAAPELSCEQYLLNRAYRDLAEAAGREDRIRVARVALHDRLEELAEQVRPRADFGLIHGELGPDHVLIDSAGHPVLIDIEGVMYFDVEWEHVFLQLRFGDRYAALAQSGLDQRRLDLYMLAIRLSLVAGPLRLLDGDFPDRVFMQTIAEHNTQAALALLPTR